MENNQVLKDRVEWPLLFSQRNKLSLEVHILPPIEYIEGSEIDLSIPANNLLNENDESFPNRVKLFESDIILGIMQDVFYVTRLDWLDRRKKANNDSEEIQALNKRDDYWNILRFIWNRLMNLVNENFEALRNSESYEDLNKILRKKSWSEETFFSSLSQPFKFRYEIYQHLSIFTESKTPRKIARIIGSLDKFVEFWNKSMERFSLMLFRLQKYKLLRLHKKFDKLANRYTYDDNYKEFINKYLKEKGGCFSLTSITDKKGRVLSDILCFSGLDDYPKYSQVYPCIKAIKNHGNFKCPKIVKVNPNIRFYLDSSPYITYGEAEIGKQRGLTYYKRMFSCCERKTFADSYFDKKKAYRMVVKFEPCELCINSVNNHCAAYNGTLIYGKKYPPLTEGRINNFQDAAKKIYSAMHPSKKRKKK